MTRNEWLNLAEEYERKAQEAYDAHNELAGQLYETKARACFDNAVLGPYCDESKGDTQC